MDLTMNGRVPHIVRVVEKEAGAPAGPQTLEQRAANMARSGATDREIAIVLQLKRRVLRKMRGHLELERASRRVELRKTQTEARAGGE